MLILSLVPTDDQALTHSSSLDEQISDENAKTLEK